MWMECVYVCVNFPTSVCACVCVRVQPSDNDKATAVLLSSKNITVLMFMYEFSGAFLKKKRIKLSASLPNEWHIYCKS